MNMTVILAVILSVVIFMFLIVIYTCLKSASITDEYIEGKVIEHEI